MIFAKVLLFLKSIPGLSFGNDAARAANFQNDLVKLKLYVRPQNRFFPAVLHKGLIAYHIA